MLPSEGSLGMNPPTGQTMSEPGRPVRLESEPPPNGVSRTMAPRANWKGFLRLSLVTCPVALYANKGLIWLAGGIVSGGGLLWKYLAG
jgi:hypothetical protein